MPRRKQQAPKRLKAHEGDIETDDVSPGELADDESDDVEEKEKKATEREAREERVKEARREETEEDDAGGKGSSNGTPSPPAPLRSPGETRSPPPGRPSPASLKPRLPFAAAANGPMSMLSKMCTALSGTDSDSEEPDSDLEAALRFNQLGALRGAGQSAPEQEEALDLRVSKVKRRKEPAPHLERSPGKAKLSSDSSGSQSPSKSVKTVFCETVPRDVLASVSRLQTDYSVLPSQVSLCRGVNGRCNFVLCTDCYQAFPNVGMLSLHLIATGHNSTKQLNSELMLQRGYLALVPPRTEFFSTCALRRKQRLPAASSRKELCAYTCSACSLSFPDFLDYTVHLTTSGHDKPEKPHGGTPAKPATAAAGDCPEEIPVNQVLKCMICQASFRTLKDLTMHMVRTKHYSHVPGHAGILLTRANAKADEKGLDEVDEEDGHILDEEECPMAVNPLAETLPATVFPKEPDTPPPRQKRYSESSASSKEDVCQNSTKAALNQMLAARSQRVPASIGRSRSVDSDAAAPKSSRSRSLKCLGCTHLFANVHKLTEHMKETGHFLAPAFGHEAAPKEKVMEPDAPTNGISVHMKPSSVVRKLWADGEPEGDSQQPGDKIKIVLKDGASKQQLLSVSSQSAEPESKKGAGKNGRTEIADDPEAQAPKQLQRAASVESAMEVVKQEASSEPPVPAAAAAATPASETQETLKTPSPSPEASPLPGATVRYVNPDNFDEIFPPHLSGRQSASAKASTSNPLDKLTSMVETAREAQFPPRLLSSSSSSHHHHHHHHRRPYYPNSPWMPLVDTPQQQYVNGGGVFPSYAGLAMVYNALSLASSSSGGSPPSSESVVSKMEKHLAAKESENVTVAEAIDKILSHSFRSEGKPGDPKASPPVGKAAHDGGPRLSKELVPSPHEACPSAKARLHARRSSKHLRNERLKRSANAKESVSEHYVHKKIAKRRHSLPPEALRNSIAKGLATQPKCDGKSLQAVKAYRADIQRPDPGRAAGTSSRAPPSSSGSRRQMVRATTVSVPVLRNAQKKGIVSMFVKKSGSASSKGALQEKGHPAAAPKEHRNSRGSPKRQESPGQPPMSEDLAQRHARMRAMMRNHTANPRPSYLDPKPPSHGVAMRAALHPKKNSARPDSHAVTCDGTREKQAAPAERSLPQQNGLDAGERLDSLLMQTNSWRDPQTDAAKHPAARVEIKTEKSDDSPTGKARDATRSAAGALRQDAKAARPEAPPSRVESPRNHHLSPTCKPSDRLLSDSEVALPGAHRPEHNGGVRFGSPDGQQEAMSHEGHISKLKRSLEMYKLFCEDANTAHEKREKRPALSEGKQSAVRSPSKTKTSSVSDGASSSASSLSSSASASQSSSSALKIKQEPGMEKVPPCPVSEPDARPAKGHAPMKRTHNNNNNTLPCSTQAKSSSDTKAAQSRTPKTPDAAAGSAAVPDARKAPEFGPPTASPAAVKFPESPLYPSSDPLHEIDKLVNSATGAQHPPLPPKIARISVDMIGRQGAYAVKREPELYVNPGAENIKSNPLEEMCKMLNATRR